MDLALQQHEQQQQQQQQQQRTGAQSAGARREVQGEETSTDADASVLSEKSSSSVASLNSSSDCGDTGVWAGGVGGQEVWAGRYQDGKLNWIKFELPVQVRDLSTKSVAVQPGVAASMGAGRLPVTVEAKLVGNGSDKGGKHEVGLGSRDGGVGMRVGDGGVGMMEVLK